MYHENKEPFRGMRGVTLDQLRALVSRGRHPALLEVYPVGDRWALVLRERGGNLGPEATLRSGGLYLKAETSGAPRLFARLETLVGVAAGLQLREGIYVRFRQLADFGPTLLEV